jgi:hypothetical protein
MALSSVNCIPFHGNLNSGKVNLKLARLPNMTHRADTKRRAIRPVRRTAVRVTWPRPVSRLRAKLRRLDGKPRNPSLTNLAQWYLDSRCPSEGPLGFLYAVPELPVSHSAESVIEALDATIVALRSERRSTAGWDSPDKLRALFDPSLAPARPPSASQDLSAFTVPLIDLPEFPESNRKSPEADPESRGSPIDVAVTSSLPAVDSDSNFAAVDDLLLGPAPGPVTNLAPLLPTPAEREFGPRPDHLSLSPEGRHPAVGRKRRHTQPQIRRKAGKRDLKSRAATLPELGLNPPQRAPTCLRVGSAIAGPVTMRKPLAQDSLKIRVPREVKKDNLPPSLQSGEKHSGPSPGPDAEVDCLITAIDVVKDNFKLQLDPIESELGKFSCDFSSAVSPGSSCTHFRDVQSRNVDEARTPSHSRSVSSDLVSTSQTYSTPKSVPSHGSSEKQDSLHHVKTTRSPSYADERSSDPYSNRPLPPLPLAPNPILPANHRTSANLVLSNATLRALLNAEDASNNSEMEMRAQLAKTRLSKRSAAIVRDFSDFTHRSFFPPQSPPPPTPPHDIRSQSDGTLWPQAPSKTRVAELSHRQPRARSLGSLAIRKKKGRGMVFAD